MKMIQHIATTETNRWRFRSWDDGNEQWSYFGSFNGKSYGVYIVERVTAPNPRTRGWHIVRRRDASDSCFPPIVGGPYESVEEAKAAFMMLARMDQFEAEESP